MPSPAPFRENLRGILSISVCNLVFLIGDMQVKLASAELPLGEIIFLRGCLATAWLSLIIVISGIRIHPGIVLNRALFWRTVAEVMSSYLYFVALFHIPIANTNTILQVVPLMVTASAAIWLREHVGWRRWTAITVGFVGVLIVIRRASPASIRSAFSPSPRPASSRCATWPRGSCRRGCRHCWLRWPTAATVVSGPIYGLLLGEHWIVPRGAPPRWSWAPASS